MIREPAAQILDDLTEDIETIAEFLNGLSDPSMPLYNPEQAITAEVIAAWLRASLNSAYGEIEVLNRNRTAATIQ